MSLVSDVHGDFSRFYNCNDPEIAFICLGDFGINYYLNKTDEKNKKKLNSLGPTFYLVRGNHEERPEHLKFIESHYDNDVKGVVYYEPQYPNIRYLMDGRSYNFNGHSALVIGGAYSVDKYVRLERFKGSWNGWFPEEQLSQAEMDYIEKVHEGKHFDFVLSHTCPYSWRPTDLFLVNVNQSSVDTTMEEWMEKFKDKITWDHWLFAHYHCDRIVNSKVQILYKRIKKFGEDVNK